MGFATAPIKKGELVIRFGNLRVFSRDSVEAFMKHLSSKDAKYWVDHAYCEGDHYCEIFDIGELINHSADANLGYARHFEDPSLAVGLHPHSAYALRPIAAGEMLTEDYNKSDENPWYRNLLEVVGEESEYLK